MSRVASLARLLFTLKPGTTPAAAAGVLEAAVSSAGKQPLALRQAVCGINAAGYGTYATANVQLRHGQQCRCKQCNWMIQHSNAQPLSLQQTRSMACSAGLGRPPPERIMIEYDPADVDMYIRVADAIEQAFPTVVVEGNEEGDGRAGSFEISTSDGFILYSKLDSKRFPDDEDWATLIATRASNGDKPAFYDGPACT